MPIMESWMKNPLKTSGAGNLAKKMQTRSGCGEGETCKRRKYAGCHNLKVEKDEAKGTRKK